MLWVYITVMCTCSSRKYPCPPQGRLMEIPRGRGISKTQFFLTKVWHQNGISRGVGVQFKKPSMGGVWIFSGTTQCTCSIYSAYWYSACSINSRSSPSKHVNSAHIKCHHSHLIPLCTTTVTFDGLILVQCWKNSRSLDFLWPKFQNCLLWNLPFILITIGYHGWATKCCSCKYI